MVKETGSQTKRRTREDEDDDLGSDVEDVAGPPEMVGNAFKPGPDANTSTEDPGDEEEQKAPNGHKLDGTMESSKDIHVY